MSTTLNIPQNLANLLEQGFMFHGHKCPAMPLGIRAGLKAMEILGVTHAQDKELFVLSETGKGHAASCFLDGIMIATGCTYGKSNIKKLYYNKMAFSLIDIKKQLGIRVSLQNEFLKKMLSSPFVELRKKGVAPQDIPEDLALGLIEKVLNMPTKEIFKISEIFPTEFTPSKGVFDIKMCDSCKEMVFANKLTIKDGKTLCVECLNKNQ